MLSEHLLDRLHKVMPLHKKLFKLEGIVKVILQEADYCHRSSLRVHGHRVVGFNDRLTINKQRLDKKADLLSELMPQSGFHVLRSHSDIFSPPLLDSFNHNFFNHFSSDLPLHKSNITDDLFAQFEEQCVSYEGRTNFALLVDMVISALVH